MDLFIHLVDDYIQRLTTEENYKQFVIRANNIHSINQVAGVMMTINVTVNYEMRPNQNSDLA